MCNKYISELDLSAARPQQDVVQLGVRTTLGMPWCVHKFGGTSVASTECLLNVKQIIEVRERTVC